MLIWSYVLRTTFYQLKELVTKPLETCEKYRYSLFLKISIERTNMPILTWSVSGCSKIRGLSILAGKLLSDGRTWMGVKVRTAKFPMEDLTSVRVGELTDGA